MPNTRDQIAMQMMIAVSNLITNEDPEKTPELTVKIWEASIPFQNEFADDETMIRMVDEKINEFAAALTA
jgi:hypothetical protein